MTRVNWESVPAAVRTYLETLAGTAGGSVIEVDGRPKYRLMAYPTDPPPDPPWTEDANRRRFELIRGNLAGNLTPDERMELESLEARLTRYVQQIAPLPLEQLRQLEQELLEKAAKAQARASA